MDGIRSPRSRAGLIFGSATLKNRAIKRSKGLHVAVYAICSPFLYTSPALRTADRPSTRFDGLPEYNLPDYRWCALGNGDTAWYSMDGHPVGDREQLLCAESLVGVCKVGVVVADWGETQLPDADFLRE